MRTFSFLSAFLFLLIPLGMKAQDNSSGSGFYKTAEETIVVNETVRFYPNPITNVLSITPSADMKNVFLFVTDVRGRVVAKTALPFLTGGQDFQYQMNDFSAGIYICIIQSAGKQFSQRIMVQ